MKWLFCVIATFSFAFGSEGEVPGFPPQAVSFPRTSPWSRHWNMTLQRQVLKSGLHSKELSINISMLHLAASVLNGCTLLIKEELPSDAFVDPYQIAQQKPNSAYRIVLPLGANSEIVYVFVNMAAAAVHGNVKIILPLHLRVPKEFFDDHSGEFSEVFWISPTVLGRCEGQKYVDNYSHGIRVLDTEFCCPYEPQSCLWIKYQPIEQSTLQDVYVPRGDLNHLPLVVSVTLIVVLVGCACLTKILLRPAKPKLKAA